MRFVFVRALVAGVALAVAVGDASADQPSRGIVLTAAPQAEKNPAEARNETPPSPEEVMNRRFPQPIRVGDLIGLPLLDWEDSTIGFIRQVVRTPEGKVRLIVPYSRWFGWAWFAETTTWGKRPVSVPLETVAILGRQVAALDMSREDFDAAPTWSVTQGQPIAPDETIRIALTRR